MDSCCQLINWYTCKTSTEYLRKSCRRVGLMPCQGRKSQQSKSKHNSHANHANANGYNVIRCRNRLTERGVYPRQGHAYAPPTGCGLLLSVTKMPASDTVLQELHTVKHQVLFFPLPSVLALLGTRLYRALE